MKLSAHEITAALRAKKEELMQEVYTVMSATLGVPPRPDTPFTWEYYEDGQGGTGKSKIWQGTPREFYAQVARGKYKVRRLSEITGHWSDSIYQSHRNRFPSSMIPGMSTGNCIQWTSLEMCGVVDRFCVRFCIVLLYFCAYKTMCRCKYRD